MAVGTGMNNVATKTANEIKRRQAVTRAKTRILDKFEMQQLKGICKAYGIGEPSPFEEDPISGKRKKRTLSGSDYKDYIFNNLKLSQIKEYADRNRMHSKRPEGFMEVNYARGRFSYYLEKAHLDEVYDLSEEADGRPIRKLHRLTSHSLRHFAITRFAKSTNGNLILSSKFARHSNPNTTMTYIHNDKKEIYDVIDSISVGEVALLKKQLK